MSFAVVDVETTGLRPATDRVIEIGIVLLSDTGQEQGEWTSLVNPRRPMAATHVHGLTEADVASAPTFSEIAHDLWTQLQGRAVVAHNASFDVAFLNAEFMRAWQRTPLTPGASVCTMELSKIYLPPGRHGLAAAAERAGIPMASHHRALADAQTAASLLRHYMDAESKGMRYAASAVARTGQEIAPASWIEAQEAAR